MEILIFILKAVLWIVALSFSVGMVIFIPWIASNKDQFEDILRIGNDERPLN
jgi:hypothetical protein